MSKYIHNLTQSDKIYRGFTIIGESYFEIPYNQEIQFANDSSLLVDIASTDVAMSKDGLSDISNINEQINFLKSNIPKDVVITDGTTDIRANQFDTDFAQIVRIKAAKRGWSYWAIPIEATTSTLGGGLFVQDASANNVPWVTSKIYNSSDEEITTAGLLNVNLGTCVKTVIDFEPNFDYEVIGGSLRINNNPSQDVRLWIVVAPDIPAIYGGSKEFASGINLKFLSADSPLEVDGRVSKAIQYNATDHRGKIRFIFKHPAGLQVNLMFIVEMYRQ